MPADSTIRERMVGGRSELTPSLASAIAALPALLAATVAVALALLSLRWPIVHDLPIILYEGYLMHELGRIPYRDFFEINAPGTMLVFSLVHQLTAGGSLASRVIDLILLTAISGFTVLALRSHGLRSGLLAAACFAIAYLAHGPVQSMQREYLCLLPLAMSTAIVFREGELRIPGWLSMGVTGLLAGCVICVKPLLVLCWFPLLLMAIATRPGREPSSPARRLGTGARVLLPFFLGIALPPLLVLVWMMRNDALRSYFDIARNYYPLYRELNGSGFHWKSGGLVVAVGRQIVDTLALISRFHFVIVSFLGLALAWTYRGRPLFAQCVAMCGIVLCGLLYVVLSGKFWVYHGFALFYGLALLAGLSVSRGLSRRPSESTWQNGILCVAVIVSLPLGMIGGEYLAWQAGRTFIVKAGRVDLVAEYLEHNTKPTDAVMPLDVTSGAIHAMYRTRRPLHGRFIYDFHVYHHVDHPYIRQLRNEMIAQLEEGKPDIVVRFDDTWLRTPGFPQLSSILERDYDVALQENDVSILRRRSRALGPSSVGSGTSGHGKPPSRTGWRNRPRKPTTRSLARKERSKGVEECRR